MKVKDTIAFIGDLSGFCPNMVARFAQHGHPVVLVAKDEQETELSLSSIKSLAPEADITSAMCAREGCWEADFIILPEKITPDKALMEKLKTVSNQKVIISLLSAKDTDLCINKEEASYFSEMLPHTHWIRANIDEKNNQVTLHGHSSSVHKIEGAFTDAGYAVKK